MKPTGLLIRPSMLLSILLVASLACAAEPRPADPKDPGDPPNQPSQMHGITLTASAPRQDIAISPPPGATTLSLTMMAIDNPSSQAFSLAASLTVSGAAAEESIGVVTPFPATQPGSFVLTLSDAARRWLARDGQLTLRLTLQPIASDRALPDALRVTVGDPAWH